MQYGSQEERALQEYFCLEFSWAALYVSIDGGRNELDHRTGFILGGTPFCFVELIMNPNSEREISRWTRLR